MPAPKLLYAQSGGVTAVINTTAAAVIQCAREHGVKVYAARNGILGVLREDLIDTSRETRAAIEALAYTPGGAFGSCRFKLGPADRERAHYQRLIEVLRAHDIRYLLYNGGNDSADTSLKIARASRRLGYPLTCIGVPKTVDNDLALTDCCPGFGSVAKYTAVSVLEASLDVASMAESSTKVFVMEVMGRHAGWIAAAAGLAQRTPDDPPHVILFPEVPFDRERFLAAVRRTVERVGWCTVVVSEGLRHPDGRFVAEAGGKDAFGHSQLGGAGPTIAAMVKDGLGLKVHWAVPDYLQRSARHLASQTDHEHAWAVGEKAVEYALAGMSGVMPVIKRISDRPYRWKIEAAPLDRIANREKKLPRSFLRRDGYGITEACRRYLAPLVRGEASPPFGKDGLPVHARLRKPRVAPRLPPWEADAE
ncbi:MAG: pyrophosphate--fructose 6-phosphate 1-phosphotransferase [Lysobacteraceae bacterium]|nr:MAG: pyrophosphate--fructose 6-phosphate 1-phosphotransferase [Xanthomonadaceae bacterium]